MIGTRLSHYLIEEKIGEGGMGVVYKAQITYLLGAKMKYLMLIIVFASIVFQSVDISAQSNSMYKKLNPAYVQGLKLFGQKKYEQALSAFKKVASDEPGFFRVYIKMVDAYFEFGRLDAATRYFSSLGRSASFEAIKYLGFGIIEQKRGNFDKAADYLLKAVRMEPGMEVHDQLIDVCAEANRTNEIEILARALVRESIHAEHGYILLGRIYENLGRKREGNVAIERALASNPKPSYLYSIAISYFGSDLEKALKISSRGLEIVLQQNDLEMQTRFLRAIGIVHWIRNDYSTALEFFKKGLALAYEIAEESMKNSHTGNIGLVYDNMANYQKALLYYNKALKLAREKNYRESEQVWLSNIGGIYLKMSEYETALKIYLESAKITKAIGSKVFENYMLGNFATVYRHLGDFKKALDYYQRAADRADKRVQSEWLGEMGLIYQQQQRYSDARAMFAKALQINQNYGSRTNEVSILNNLGALHHELGEFTAAQSYFENALGIALKIGESLKIWKSHYGLGVNYEAQKEYESALSQYELAAAEIQKIRGSFFAEEHKSVFFANQIQVYEHLVNLFIQLFRRSSDREYLSKAYYYTESMKARSMLDALGNGYTFVKKGIDEEILRRRQAVERKLMDTQSLVARELSKEKPSRKMVDSLSVELQTIRRRYEEIRQELIWNYPEYASLSGETDPLEVGEIQDKLLRKNEVIMQYLVAENKIFLFILTEDSAAVETIEIEKTVLTKMVGDLVQPLREVTSLSDIKFDLRLAHELYEILVAPAISMLNNEAHLIVIPDGVLYYLPFEVLVANVEVARSGNYVWDEDFREANYLIENHPVSYSPSASVLAHLRNKTVAERPRGDLLAFGSPNYYSVTDDEKQLLSSLNWNFSPLRFSRDEINGVSRQFEKARTFLGKDATEENAKTEAPNFNFLHFSAHGLLDERQPLYSGIVLTQDEDETEDGFLQTYEIYNLDLNADLVTLSACETGLGKLQRGEGIMGLTRAFMYAGARSVLMSLWKVHDRSTTQLMNFFYRNLLEKGLNQAEALRQAKLQLMHETKKIGGEKLSYAHPFFWAPFVIMGKTELQLPAKKTISKQFLVSGIIIFVLVILVVAFLLKRSSARNQALE